MREQLRNRLLSFGYSYVFVQKCLAGERKPNPDNMEDCRDLVPSNKLWGKALPQYIKDQNVERGVEC